MNQRSVFLIIGTSLAAGSTYFLYNAQTHGGPFNWMAGVVLLAALVATIGIFSIFLYKEWAEKTESYFMCFAAGVLISVSLLHIIPKSVQMNEYGGFLTLTGFLFLLFVNRVIESSTGENTSFGIVTALGVGIHSFVDGVVYAVTFQTSVTMGIMAAIGMVTHEFSEGVITYSILLDGGVREKIASSYAFLIAALTTPIGAFLVYPFVNRLGQQDLGLMVGISAGAILYVGASHLLPEATERGENHSYIAFFGGVMVALFIVLTKIL